MASEADRRARAWLILVGALAVHVADEALTGFLDFYNPLVLSIRSRVPLFPMPTFSFGAWLAGLVAAVVVLALLGPVVRGGGRAARAVAWIFSVLMFANGVAHLAGSLYFDRWLPGATSAPLLIVASALLAVETRARSGRR